MRTTPPTKYTVAVRTLCEFGAKQGDLDRRFTPSATALEGIAGHAVVAARRGPSYEAEASVSGEFEGLVVRGRADGFDAARGVLEEVKTFRGDLDAMPQNRRALHWAQARVYAALMCRQRGLDGLQVALVYFDVATQQETVLRQQHDAASLQAFFEDMCRRFRDWAAQELAHRTARDRALADLRFPHADFRPGQRPLAEAVYRAASTGRHLLAQAPTGIGKTIGTIFPLLKACPVDGLDKLFFLAAKSPGRAVKLQALGLIRDSAPGLPLRVLELVARDKACEHPGKPCQGDACPLAQGFFDKLPAARSEALALRPMDKAALRDVALKHALCPYYLAQELVRWADVVVGDYNYWFDGGALLHGMTLAGDWRVALLVDEAHNLVGRARGMYSAELSRALMRTLKAAAPPAVAAALARVERAWAELERRRQSGYDVLADVPSSMLAALQSFNTAVGDQFAAEPASIGPPLQQGWFDTLQFARLAESFGEHSLCELSTAGPASEAGVEAAGPSDLRLGLRNIVPAPFLKPRFAAARSSTLFSATLAPRQFHADLLGLPADAAWLDVPSPFRPAQLRVHVAGTISTRYPDRNASLEALVALMASQYAEAPGNYLAFFSSFEYLRQAATLMLARHPALPQWQQSRTMNEAAREHFLARFTPQGRGIGFAVLGGAFAEGIDLPGRRLIGAFIATLGLPPVNPVNQQTMTRLQAIFGKGREYTYVYPGLQKVVQAAGRVIRTTADTGTLHLIDDRYAQPAVAALLPAWWAVPGRVQGGDG